MPRVDLPSLPDEARLWIFGATEALTETEEERLLFAVDAFLEEWNAHGHPLTAGREWVEHRFLVVAVDERTAPPSGCSIDAMVRVLKGLEDELGIRIATHGPVFWRENGSVRSASRADFQSMAREGEVDSATRVFDTTLVRLGQYRSGEFERPAGRSWHAKAFLRA